MYKIFISGSCRLLSSFGYEYNNKVYFNNLLSNVNNKKFSISIIGLGYVGLPRALNFCEENIVVHGY